MEGLEGLKAGKQQAWTPLKSYWCVLHALACGVRDAKKVFGAFGGFEAWQTAGLNAIKKRGLGALACGVSVAKKAFGAFGGFEGWQTAGLKAI